MSRSVQTDTEKKIAEIREALANATPGPWNFAVFEDSRHVIFDNTFLSRHIAEIVRGGVESEQREEDNAHLIANAPEWLQWAVQEIERLQDELDREREESRKLREERDAYYNNARYTEAAFHEVTSLRSQLQSAQQEIERYLQQRDKLIEVLRWYADEDTHMIKRRSDGDYAPIALDHGKRARKILKQIGVTLSHEDSRED